MKKRAKKEPSATELVDKLLDGGPRQARDAYMKLSKLVCGVKALTALGDAPRTSKTDPRVSRAIRELGDKRAAVRARAAGALVALSSDAVDMRTPLRALAKALTDPAASVRRPAALAAYYAFDMQAGIRELAVLDEPLAIAARDTDEQVRERAQMALEAARRR